ncbi:hypothetical protein M433DRAFT_273535 [Acidomyces richmondensis BFW]|nr:hypothetical protein M433DRAFT_273535 [Acidomyces richmondensis BFW]
MLSVYRDYGKQMSNMCTPWCDFQPAISFLFFSQHPFPFLSISWLEGFYSINSILSRTMMVADPKFTNTWEFHLSRANEILPAFSHLSSCEENGKAVSVLHILVRMTWTYYIDPISIEQSWRVRILFGESLQLRLSLCPLHFCRDGNGKDTSLVLAQRNRNMC